jgi:hypothetical protein
MLKLRTKMNTIRKFEFSKIPPNCNKRKKILIEEARRKRKEQVVTTRIMERRKQEISINDMLSINQATQ